MSLRYAKQLIFWGVVFVISLFLIFTGFGNTILSESGDGNGSQQPPIGPERPGEPEEETANWNFILGVAAAIISGAGFMVTTIFALRDDRRETALHDLQIKNLQKEIEQKDLEIKKLRKEQGLQDSTKG